MAQPLARSPACFCYPPPSTLFLSASVRACCYFAIHTLSPRTAPLPVRSPAGKLALRAKYGDAVFEEVDSLAWLRSNTKACPAWCVFSPSFAPCLACPLPQTPRQRGGACAQCSLAHSSRLAGRSAGPGAASEVGDRPWGCLLLIARVTAARAARAGPGQLVRHFCAVDRRPHVSASHVGVAPTTQPLLVTPASPCAALTPAPSAAHPRPVLFA
jgi:hypothetical protein